MTRWYESRGTTSKPSLIAILCNNIRYRKGEILNTQRYNRTPAGTRTPNQLIKSQLLYQLSYGCSPVTQLYNLMIDPSFCKN